ncbi:baseplate J/gp47 family protein [Aquimarina longa]|uniref:baseplate J/gp47 family protein n=1 Tax=Aquimarina longa TaxID=1080221 RepID=UPI0007851C3E|nr:baseplate J/gp47 family protein [Aquimarina longa]
MKTSIPEIINPLNHSGTNRFERLGKELDFNYVKIEERHEADFIAQAEKLAEAIQFYNQNDTPFGDWVSFFDKQSPVNQPHRALFIAFLRLLEALNEHANGLTRRHLDFYYQEVLQFGKKEVKPAKAHLFFSCAKTLKERFLEKSTLLNAGENKNGKKILFQLVDELVVNKAKVTSYFGLNQHSDKFGNRLFSKDYSSFLAGNTEQDKQGFPTFGEHQLTHTKKNGTFVSELLAPNQLTMDAASIGFALSSPILKLEEGNRNITLRLSLAGTYPNNFNTVKELFKFELTTEDGWFELPQKEESGLQNSNTYKKRRDGNIELCIELTLRTTHPAIIDYNQDIHKGAYHGKNPIIRMVLNHHTTNTYGYGAWKNTKIKNVGLKVNVTGIRSLIVQNELSTLDSSKPFRPFGPIPSIGNNFYIGHSEIFKNPLHTASINIKWKDLPIDGFDKHYEGYQEHISNTCFKISTALLENRVWKNIHNTINLFPDDISSTSTSISFTTPQLEYYKRKTDTLSIKEWNHNTNYGFLQLHLTAPNKSKFQAFGHKVYAKEVLRNSQLPENDPTKKNVEQPYVPVVESLTLNYETEEIFFSDNETDQFYHVAAFGQKTNILNNPLRSCYLLPHYTHEGELYIGLEEVITPQTVSILFQFIEGSGDADQSQINPAIEWFYLSGDEWKVIDRLRISKDTTKNLLRTGIMHFDLPIDCDDQHHIMPTGLYWLKAGIQEKAMGIDRIQNIYTQGAVALEQQPEINDHVIQPNTITKLYNKGKGITEISQPAASFGGTKKENEEGFYTRISERLRHKDRGVTIWDYERLVLEEFPELYKVKCLNHTNNQTEMVAGHVMIAIIPNLRNKQEKFPFQPKLSMHKRMDVYHFLRERITPFIFLRIENPIYEPIKLSFNVGFHKGRDEGFYGKKLHQQLQEFLSPWAFENTTEQNADLVFGGKLHKSVILKFIEDQEYVDFVNDFNMYHQYQNPSIHEYFKHEISSDNATHSSSTTEQACDRIKIAFQAEDTQALTSLIEVKVRFLKGITDIPDTKLGKKMSSELQHMLASKVKKGITITKTLIRTIIKSIFYVDKIVALSFYKDLPNGFVLEDVDVAIAKTSRSIMVTSEQHRIGVYKAGDFKCEGNVMIGIGFMIVEADFIIPEVEQKTKTYVTR